MKEVIKKKLPIVLFIVTILLLGLNYVITGNPFFKQQKSPMTPTSAEDESIVAFKYEEPDLGKWKVMKHEKIKTTASKEYLPEAFQQEENSREKEAPSTHKSIEPSEHPMLGPDVVELHPKENIKETETGKNIIKLSVSDIRIILSGALFLSALLVILLNPKNDSLQKWAIGVIGSLIGFWLK